MMIVPILKIHGLRNPSKEWMAPNPFRFRPHLPQRKQQHQPINVKLGRDKRKILRRGD